MEITRITAADYEELIALLNDVFTIQNRREMDFEKELPKMCIRDEEHMGKHIGIRENGKLVAALGIYPLPVTVGDQKLLFSTVGNVVTHWDYTGKGYMNLLLEEAMKELSRIGADGSRLGGLRQRYNRFGYELCGTNYQVTLTGYNVLRRYASVCTDSVVFSQIGREDTEALAFCKELHDKNGIFVERSADNGYRDMFLSMVAWRNKPWIAKDEDGTPIGYLCADDAGENIAEFFGVDTASSVRMLCAWQKHVQKDITFHIFAHQLKLLRNVSGSCEKISIVSPCHFKIIHFDRVTDALMKLKASQIPMPEGEYVIGIRDYGAIRLYVENGQAGCEKTGKTPNITLNKLEAARFLYGPLPPFAAGEADGAALRWLPLPLSWNLQDRV